MNRLTFAPTYIILLAAACSKTEDPSPATAQASAPVTAGNRPDNTGWGPNVASKGMALVQLEPADQATDVGRTPPTVTVMSGGKLGPALNAIADRVHLLTWPEGAEQAVTKTLTDATEKTPASIVLQPTSGSLADRWYTLKVDPLPAGVSFAPYGPARRAADGSADARFRPGSDPKVAFVELCEKGGSVYGAAVFSERLEIGPAPEQLLTFAGASCSYQPPAPAPAPEKGADTSRNSIAFTCTSLPSSLDVGLASGPHSKAGKTLPAATFKLKKSELEKMGENCLLFRP